MQVRIEWRSRLTGFEGHGNWFPLGWESVLSGLAREMDQKYPDLVHVIHRSA